MKEYSNARLCTKLQRIAMYKTPLELGYSVANSRLLIPFSTATILNNRIEARILQGRRKDCSIIPSILYVGVSKR